MPSNDTYVNLSDTLEDIEDRFYQVVYDEDENSIKLKCVSYGEKVPEIIIFLTIKMFDYSAQCTQYTIPAEEIPKRDHLKMMGILFTKNNRTVHSLDMVNLANTDDIEVRLYTYEDYYEEDDETTKPKQRIVDDQLIKKVEDYPGNKEILNYMLSLLSDERVEKIFQDKEE